MKKFFCTILLLLFSSAFYSVNAQYKADTTAECYIRANKMDVIGDSLFIDWEIHINAFETGSHNSLSLTPVLQHDIKTLLKALNALIAKGHTVIIIEHNLEVIKSADYVIDLGPEGGAAGGNLVCCGTPEEISHCKDSYTGHYLKEKLR